MAVYPFGPTRQLGPRRRATCHQSPAKARMCMQYRLVRRGSWITMDAREESTSFKKRPILSHICIPLTKQRSESQPHYRCQPHHCCQTQQAQKQLCICHFLGNVSSPTCIRAAILHLGTNHPPMTIVDLSPLRQRKRGSPVAPSALCPNLFFT